MNIVQKHSQGDDFKMWVCLCYLLLWKSVGFYISFLTKDIKCLNVKMKPMHDLASIFFSLISILPLRSTPSSQALHFLATKAPYINDFSSQKGFFFPLNSCVHAEFLQSCWTLCNTMANSPLHSPVYGILQARTLECVVLPSSRGSSWPRDQTHISLSLLCLLHW